MGRQVVTQAEVDAAKRKLRRVKIIFTQDTSDDYYSNSIVRAGTDWEEITEAELEFLSRNMHLLMGNRLAPDGMYARLVIEDNEPIRSRLASVRELIKEEQRKKEERDRAAKAKRLEKELKKKAKTEAAERELFEKLKEKFSS